MFYFTCSTKYRVVVFKLFHTQVAHIRISSDHLIHQFFCCICQSSVVFVGIFHLFLWSVHGFSTLALKIHRPAEFRVSKSSQKQQGNHGAVSEITPYPHLLGCRHLLEFIWHNPNSARVFSCTEVLNPVPGKLQRLPLTSIKHSRTS